MRVLIEEVAHGYIDERHQPVEKDIIEEGLILNAKAASLLSINTTKQALMTLFIQADKFIYCMCAIQVETK